MPGNVNAVLYQIQSLPSVGLHLGRRDEPVMCARDHEAQRIPTTPRLGLRGSSELWSMKVTFPPRCSWTDIFFILWCLFICLIDWFLVLIFKLTQNLSRKSKEFPYTPSPTGMKPPPITANVPVRVLLYTCYNRPMPMHIYH